MTMSNAGAVRQTALVQLRDAIETDAAEFWAKTPQSHPAVDAQDETDDAFAGAHAGRGWPR